jgi:1-acyl-sn-glycerol-3-phosphate acyltransferase
MTDKRKHLLARWTRILLGLVALGLGAKKLLGSSDESELASMKKQKLKDARSADRFTKYHEVVRKSPPNWKYDLTRLFVVPFDALLFRDQGFGMENIPPKGSVIFVPNHNSFMDHFLFGRYVWPRKVHFVAKSQLFKWPIGELLFAPGGVIPARRGHKDKEARITIETVLKRGGDITVYMHGGRSRSGKIDDQKYYPGAIRHAVETGIPIVPVGIRGSEKIRNWKRLPPQFPKVTVLFGEAIYLPKVEDPTDEYLEVEATKVHLAIKALLEDLEETAELRRNGEDLPVVV